MESEGGGVLRGLESTPKEVLLNFLGVQLPLAGGQTPLTPLPVKYSPGRMLQYIAVAVCCRHNFLKALCESSVADIWVGQIIWRQNPQSTPTNQAVTCPFVGCVQ